MIKIPNKNKYKWNLNFGIYEHWFSFGKTGYHHTGRNKQNLCLDLLFKKSLVCWHFFKNACLKWFVMVDYSFKNIFINYITLIIRLLRRNWSEQILRLYRFAAAAYLDSLQQKQIVMNPKTFIVEISHLKADWTYNRSLTSKSTKMKGKI